MSKLLIRIFVSILIIIATTVLVLFQELRFIYSYLLFVLIGLFTVVLVYSVSTKRVFLLSVIFCPLVIAISSFLTCIGNPEALMWFPLGLVVLEVVNLPFWVFLSLYLKSKSIKHSNV